MALVAAGTAMADPAFAVFAPAEHLARTGAVIVIR